MPIRNYPFWTHPKVGIPAPILPIRIVNPDNGKTYDTFALVDTGATETVIPDFIAKAVGKIIGAPETASLGIGAAGNLPIYLHTFQIEVFRIDPTGHIDTGTVVHRIKKHKMGVIEGLPLVLLGVADFLQSFLLSVHYPDRQFSMVLAGSKVSVPS